MKTLHLAIELSHIALHELGSASSSDELLSKTRERLSSRVYELGSYINCNQVSSGLQYDDMQVEEYELEYEKQTLAFRLLYFKPRNSWKIQNFQILNKKCA